MPLSSVAASDGTLPAIELGGIRVGPGEPCFIIAEAGVNHDGDLLKARRMVEVAARCGAQAVKFQTFRAHDVVSREAPLAEYQARNQAGPRNQLELLQGLELDAPAHQVLAADCREHGLVFLSTPFDRESVALLQDLGVAAFKIGSGDLTNLPLLRAVGGCGRPVILSTGMSYLREVELALEALERAGCREVALLHCVSQYPAPPEEANLRAMDVLRSAFGRPVGFSDHTPGTEVALAAVARGACLLEKHFTLDRSAAGPDHAASLELEEFSRLVESVRRVECSLGRPRKQPAPCEAEMRFAARRSLASARPLPAGHRLAPNDLIPLRPASGISPLHCDEVVGRRLRRAVASHQLLRWEDLE